MTSLLISAVLAAMATPVSEKELRHTAFEVLTMLMEAIAGTLDDTTFRQHADALGRRRAQQGVPISTLIDAVQLDFLVIWNRIRQAAGGNQEVLISRGPTAQYGRKIQFLRS